MFVEIRGHGQLFVLIQHGITQTFQYVPLIKNLQWVLQNMEVCEEDM